MFIIQKSVALIRSVDLKVHFFGMVLANPLARPLVSQKEYICLACYEAIRPQGGLLQSLDALKQGILREFGPNPRKLNRCIFPKILPSFGSSWLPVIQIHSDSDCSKLPNILKDNLITALHYNLCIIQVPTRIIL